jgi:serine/threonine protein kinase
MPSPFADAEAYLSREDTLKIRPSAEFKKYYEILRKIGNGAFSEVYLVEDRQTHVQYAAKMIDRVAVSNPRQVWTELHVLHTLSHPSIIRLFGAFANERYLLLLLEHAPGGELYDRINAQNDFGESDAVDVIKKLVDAIAYLHSHKVVHRDIKPENILFMDASSDSLKLADFGLAGVIAGDALLTTCAGTPGFMAPEVLRSSGYGPQCDMWSVGVLTYLLLSGTLPFNSSSPFVLYNSILNGAYEFGREFESVSDDAIDFVKRCLTVNPQARLTPKAALSHGWLSESPRVVSRGVNLCREGVLRVLEERRNLKTYRPAVFAVSFISKLKNKLNIAKAVEDRANAEDDPD